MSLHPDTQALADAPARVIAASLDWTSAWQRVAERAGMPGVDAISVSRFRRGAEAAIRTLELELASGEYRPMPVRAMAMTKKSGSLRTLLIPTVRDRVAQTAVALWLGKKWNPEFDAASFAYRPGMGVHAALRSLRELYSRGYRWVFDADIRSYFDTIDHATLFTRLETTLGSTSSVVAWLRSWLRSAVWTGEDIRRVVRGVPQGSPVSPLLSNFYLDPFDRVLRTAGIPFVRYADDFLVLAKTPFDLASARKIVESALAALHLSLNPEKTRITSFVAWFRFVGAEFHDGDILLPFDKPKRKAEIVFLSPPMPRVLLRAWHAGRLPDAGIFRGASSMATPHAGKAPVQETASWVSGSSLERLRRRE